MAERAAAAVNAQRKPRPSQPGGSESGELVEIVGSREAAMRRLAELAGGAQRDLVIIDGGVNEAHLPRSLVRMAAAQGVPVRSIYSRRLLLGKVDDHEPAVKPVPGEQARMLVAVPATCLLVDASVVAAPIIHDDAPLSGLIIIQPSSVLDLAVGLAEMLWQQAVPVHTDGALSPDDAMLLSLLQQGLKDRAIARALGIGERTVQRRLSTLMAELGAKTRFQAALNAVRRGWI